MKKTSISNPVKSLGYIKWYQSKPKPVKNPSNSIRCYCQKICSWLRRHRTILNAVKNKKMCQKKTTTKKCLFWKITISFDILNMSYSNCSLLYSFKFLKHLCYLTSNICCLFEVTIQNRGLLMKDQVPK